jgi:hypothetical protein
MYLVYVKFKLFGISIFEQIIISVLSGLNDMNHFPDQVLSLFRSWFITNSKVFELYNTISNSLENKEFSCFVFWIHME